MALGASLAAPVRDLTVIGPGVALGQVVDVSGLPASIRGRASALTVAAFRRGQDRLNFRSRRLAARAEALMPALRPWLETLADGQITVRRAPSVSASATPPACARMARPVAAGSILTNADLTTAPCGNAVDAATVAVRYDRRTQVLRAVRGLQIDETIAAPPPALLADIAPGQHLVLHAKVGPVAIQREVEAIQAGRPGQAIFVKTADGAVFSAPAGQVSR